MESINMTSSNYEFVYCIYDGTAVKIGKARDVKSRVKMLQTGNPNRLVPLFAAAFPCGMAGSVERSMLECFEDRKMVGEWLNVSPELVLKKLMVTAFSVIGTRFIAYSDEWAKRVDSAILYEKRARSGSAVDR